MFQLRFPEASVEVLYNQRAALENEAHVGHPESHVSPESKCHRVSFCTGLSVSLITSIQHCKILIIAMVTLTLSLPLWKMGEGGGTQVDTKGGRKQSEGRTLKV